jgi:hypothetical protein
MIGYRLYFLDDSGHIKSATDILCETDEEADVFAKEQNDGRAMELWKGARVVKKYAPRQDA